MHRRGSDHDQMAEHSTLTTGTNSLAVGKHDVLLIDHGMGYHPADASPGASVVISEPNLSPPAGRWRYKLASGALLLLAATFGWHDVFVLTAMVAIVAGTTRRILAVCTVLLFTVSFPPFSWPTWWFCLAPLLWMWRERASKRTVFQCAVEALAVGFAMGWLSTEFVRAGLPAWGWLVHAAACLVFSLQFVVIALTIRFTRDKPVFLAAPICALTAVGGDLFEAWCGVSWSVTNLALTVGATPLAQWSRWITPFGVSGVLYLVNFHFVRENSSNLGRRWIGPAMGVGIAVLAWYGGSLSAAAVPIEPLRFSALLVQPHRKVSLDEPWRPWVELDRITRTSLSRDGSADLLVWPESCLSESWSVGQQSDVNDIATRLTVQDFAHVLTPAYKTNCLVGAVMLERGTAHKYGLEVAEVRRYNCGYLVSKSGIIARHEKLDLVPFKEGLPGVLNQDWIRNRVLPALQLNQPLTPGRSYDRLSFHDREGKERSIAVSVCYESLLPWLPQYRRCATADAIVHLIYDGNTAEHPEMMQRQVRACQYRAIETRKWNLVCSTWSGSVIIDPAGKIVAQLSATAGTLRSDAANAKGN
jgi:apolipoprotein N-acyltransferase